MYRHQERKRDDCPNCGAKEGAVMGSSDWHHNFPCCGNSCGLELRAKIEANTSTDEFVQAIFELGEAQEKVREIKYKGLNVDANPFEFMNGEI